MSSWGKNSDNEGSAETKPRYLTDAEKRDTYATERGWTVAAGGNDGISGGVAATGTSIPDREVIVAIGDLGGSAPADTLGAASISSVNWNDTTYSLAEANTISVSVNWNETVTVTDGATIVVTNTGTGGTHTLVAPASTTNRATFVLDMAADVDTWAADDVLTIATQDITGTILGAGSVAAEVNISAIHGLGAGAVTVVA
tara:strand:- start:14 stop:613 length:600 start_codon:yes stop_codon:yes gene_type:complete